MRTAIALIALLSLGELLILAVDADASSMDERCKEAVLTESLGNKNTVGFWREKDSVVKITGRYSPVIDGCIALIEADLKNEWMILDLYNRLIEQWLPRSGASLFWCDKDGVDNVVISKARKFGGRIGKVHYGEYLDDGEGGLPRTLKMPDQPYSRADCKWVFDKKVRELKNAK